MTTIKNPLPASLTVPAGGDIAGYAPDFWSDYGQFNPPLVHSWQAVIASWVERIVDLI
jgi:hypothetical protein